MLSESQIEKLKNVFSKFKQVKAVYLFGSYVEDKENCLSDIDLGVLLDEGEESSLKLDILTEMARAGFCNVDILILNQAILLHQFEAIKHNCLIYQKNDFDKGSYYSLVVRKFMDFRPLLEVQRYYLKERMLYGK